MSGFKEPDFADRQKAAQQAKQNLLNKFRAQPGPDDPAVAARLAERAAVAAARAKTQEAREAAKAEQKRREAQALAEAAATLAREKEEEAARQGGGRNAERDTGTNGHVGHSLPGKPVSKATGAALVRDGDARGVVTPRP